MGVLNGKTAIITGSGSGLGRATALAYANEGANVVLCGRQPSKLEDVQKEIAAAGGTAIAVKADVSIEENVKQLVKEAIAKFGRVDILVNNAAVLEAAQTSETSLESWNYHLQNNLTSAFLATRECLVGFTKQQYGRIINITSGLAVNGSGGFTAYSVSKAGLEALTRTVADEVRGTDILVNMFNPGTIRSDMHATGRNPMEVTPELINLASLPARGMNGKLVEAGQLIS